MTTDSWKKVKEGKTQFEIIQDAERIYDASVFYNPKMTINRDITLLMIETISKLQNRALFFVDALAGTGVRSFRLLNELSKTTIDSLIINDKNPKAVEIISKNISSYEASEKLELVHSDALDLLYNIIKERKPIDVIDIDPFGSPISFIETSLNALKRNSGYLFATATDLQVLCGKYSEACFRIYNSHPTRYYLCHEVALRILIYNAITSAGRLGLEIVPILSYHFEHYLRVKVKIEKSKEAANEQHKQIGFVIFCPHCSYHGTYTLNENYAKANCPICNNLLEKAGPLWLGKLYSKKYLIQMQELLEGLELPNEKKIAKLLEFVLGEIDNLPFFYDFPLVTRQSEKKGIKIHDIIDTLLDAGFEASRTVFSPEGLKTNANYEELVKLIKKF